MSIIVRKDQDGGTEELVAMRIGPGELFVVWTALSWFPAAVTCRAGHAALTSRSNEGACVSEGAQPDEKAALICSDCRRSRKSKFNQIAVSHSEDRGFGFVLWLKFRGE